jgi:CBS domain containing-hemolysin-like protein/mannitol/fructose-specific phosphotransferase system IIA component (Ntr-type)
MQIALFLLIAIFLLLLNAFFVLAEFASVKIRPTQMGTLAAGGDKKAKRVQYIQTHLDEFLSVCQLGITFASIGLGFVGEPAFAKLIGPMINLVADGAWSDVLTHGIAVSISYVLVSFLHIVIGELVPKSIAIRATQKSVFFIVYPMFFFRYLFAVPIWFLNTTVNGILRIFNIPTKAVLDRHTEDEIRLILDQSQSSGLLSFRRLLFIENILDLGELTVRNAMRVRKQVCCLQLGASKAALSETISRTRFSRYPLISQDSDRPIGFIHIKDLLLADLKGDSTYDLESLVRPCLKALETDSLEKLLSVMQRKGNHLALVYNETGAWSGIVTLEDAVEEVIGTIEEEFSIEQTVHLSDFLTPECVFLDVEGSTIVAATRNVLRRVNPAGLPAPADELMLHVAERERLGSSYVGLGLAIPHARLANLSQSIVLVARLKEPIPVSKGEVIDLLFILLTPAGAPRIHQILLSHIAGIFESGFLKTQLDQALTPAQLCSVIVTAEQTVLA